MFFAFVLFCFFVSGVTITTLNDQWLCLESRQLLPPCGQPSSLHISRLKRVLCIGYLLQWEQEHVEHLNYATNKTPDQGHVTWLRFSTSILYLQYPSKCTLLWVFLTVSDVSLQLQDLRSRHRQDNSVKLFTASQLPLDLPWGATAVQAGHMMLEEQISSWCTQRERERVVLQVVSHQKNYKSSSELNAASARSDITPQVLTSERSMVRQV